MLPQAGALLICRISRQINKGKTLRVLSAFAVNLLSSVLRPLSSVVCLPPQGNAVPGPQALARRKLSKDLSYTYSHSLPLVVRGTPDKLSFRI